MIEVRGDITLQISKLCCHHLRSTRSAWSPSVRAPAGHQENLGPPRPQERCGIRTFRCAGGSGGVWRREGGGGRARGGAHAVGSARGGRSSYVCLVVQWYAVSSAICR